jgi:hypothetical protein
MCFWLSYSLRLSNFRHNLRVLLLTGALATSSSCSVVDDFYGESCKTHAYIHQSIGEYVVSQISHDSPARMAIIPFTVPANLSPSSPHQESLGFALARKIHAHFLGFEWIPIIEVMNRRDWPGMREEFFTGNYGAIAQAREAGYNLILVGYLEIGDSLTSATLLTKVIDVESGITISYIKAEGVSLRRSLRQSGKTLRSEKWIPSLFELGLLYEELSQCSAKRIKEEQDYSDEEAPITSFFESVTEIFEGDE